MLPDYCEKNAEVNKSDTLPHNIIRRRVKLLVTDAVPKDLPFRKFSELHFRQFIVLTVRLATSCQLFRLL